MCERVPPAALVSLLLLPLLLAACGAEPASDPAEPSATDAAPADAGPLDAGADAARRDDAAGPPDLATSGDLEPGDAATPDASPDGGPQARCRGTVSLDELGLSVAEPCGDALLRLTPGLRTVTGGTWQASAGDCVLAADALRCAVPDLGTLVLERLDAHTVQLAFEASAAATLEALGLMGNVRLPEGRAWLSNGFQSWSGAGMIAIGRPPTDAALQAALLARGDMEVARSGAELSWWFTVAGGGASNLLLAALSAERLPTWAAVHRSSGDRANVRLMAGGSGERVALAPGERLVADPWRVELGTDLELLQREWADALPTRRRAVQRPAAAGWNSWYELWDTVDAEAVRANARHAAELLTPALGADPQPLWAVIDDGWQQAWGAWEPNARFPDGVAGLAAELETQGQRTGLWLAPLLAHPELPVVAEHPDWFLPREWDFGHMEHGPLRVLDVTHPEAAAHLQATIRRIRGWGVGLLKIDFLFAGAWNAPRHAPSTGLQAYGRALQLVREAAGEEALLLAVGAPGLPSLPWVDAWRVGGDVAPEQTGPAWAFIANGARTLSARWPLCRATLCDADPVLLRSLSANEVDAESWVVALAGGALFLSDDLRVLPARRHAWAPGERLVALALGGTPGVPLDPFPDEPPATLTLPLTDHLLGRTTLSVPGLWRAADGGLVRLNVLDEPRSVAGEVVPGRSAVAAE